MYEQYLISKNQVYLYGILIAGVVGIIVYIYNTITKKENGLTGSIKTFGILAVALIILGLQCRTAIFTIDYDTMVYDKTVIYASALHNNNFDDTELNESLKYFMTAKKPDFAKDSLKQKCQRLTLLYLSLFNDFIDYCNLGTDEIFSLSSQTNNIYKQVSIEERQKILADSLLLPIVNEVNNKKGEIYASLRMAKGSAELEELEKMRISLIQNQENIKDYYLKIFSEKLK